MEVLRCVNCVLISMIELACINLELVSIIVHNYMWMSNVSSLWWHAAEPNCGFVSLWLMCAMCVCHDWVLRQRVICCYNDKATFWLLKQVTWMFNNPLIVFRSSLNGLSRWKQCKLPMGYRDGNNANYQWTYLLCTRGCTLISMYVN